MPIRKRIIPCLLLSENDLVKTIKFSNRKYIGDPLNSIKIFNQKKADEIIIIDIDSTSKKSPINYDLIKKMANESRMPISYGGGIKSYEEINRIINLGVEKIICSSLFFDDLDVLKKAIDQFGRQSISLCFDYKLIDDNYFFYINNGITQINITFDELLNRIQNLNPGEIVFNSIDRDGTFSGLDDFTMKYMSSKIEDIPTTYLGGLSSYEELKKFLHSDLLFSGISAGSLFVYKGKFRAVLINYDNLFENEKNI